MFFSGKSLILKERAIRTAKKSAVKNIVSSEEVITVDIESNKDITNVEQEESFFAGFESFDFDDSPTTKGEVPKEKKVEKKEEENDKEASGNHGKKDIII